MTLARWAAVADNLRDIEPRLAPDGTNWCIGCDTTVSARADARLCPECTKARSNFRRTRNRQALHSRADGTPAERKPRTRNRIRPTRKAQSVSTLRPEALEPLVPLAVSSFRALIELYQAPDWTTLLTGAPHPGFDTRNAGIHVRDASRQVRRTSVALTQATVRLLEAAGLVEIEGLEISEKP